MIYLFFGEDTFRSRRELHKLIEQISKKEQPSFSWFAPESFLKPAFEELLRTKSLFGEKQIIICENILKESETVDFVCKNLKPCANSENIFIFWEEELQLPLTAFKKHAEEIKEFNFPSLKEMRIWLDKEAKEKEIILPIGLKEELIQQAGGNLWLLSRELEKYSLVSKEDFLLKPKQEKVNIFHISDAVALKDRSRAWLLFQKALMSGLDPEEIFWKIVWQIKNLLLVKKLMPASEKKIAEITRLHPFVVKKTALGCRNYEEKELSKYFLELIKLYHDARNGMADFETGIEKFLIKL